MSFTEHFPVCLCSYQSLQQQQRPRVRNVSLVSRCRECCPNVPLDIQKNHGDNRKLMDMSLEQDRAEGDKETNAARLGGHIN